jgi:hypothetical protein
MLLDYKDAKKEGDRSSSILTVTAIMASAIAAIIVFASAGVSENGIAYPQKESYNYGHHAMMKPGEYSAGTVASIQNDENGSPTWIISGLWKGSLITDKSKEGVGSQSINATNSTATTKNTTTTSSNTANLPTARFEAMLNMIITNGSAMHEHAIYNLTLTEIFVPDNNTSVFNGTATITMKNGPVQNVPVSIKILDGNVISIWADPTINNHFGNTPIFGTATKDVIIKK